VPPTPARLPELEARSLEGRAYRLPGDLDGELNVLVVAFERRQQRLVDDWLPSLLALESCVAGLRVYELPTISRAWSPARWFIDGGMVRGIPDAEARARTLTVYTDVGRVLESLGLESAATVAVLLIDRAGNVAWRGGGEYETAQLRALTVVVTSRLA